MRAVRAIDDPDRKLRALVGSRWSVGRGGRAAAWGGDADGCKELVRHVEAVKEEILGEVADRVLRHLLVAIAKEVRSAADARRAEGGLEFHDLLVLAREMLRTSTRARKVLHERYTHLLLDEFQDTDPIQIELAMLIATSSADGAPDHWSTLPVDPGRLFF